MGADLVTQFGGSVTHADMVAQIEDWLTQTSPASVLYHPYISEAGSAVRLWRPMRVLASLAYPRSTAFLICYALSLKASAMQRVIAMVRHGACACRNPTDRTGGGAFGRFTYNFYLRHLGHRCARLIVKRQVLPALR